MTTRDFLRRLGERDARAGKSINAFYDAPLAGHHRHNEHSRGEYEIGYRAAKQEMRREMRAAERGETRMRPMLGRMSEQDTMKLLQEIIEECLTEERLFEVLNKALSAEQKGELAVAWTNDNE